MVLPSGEIDGYLSHNGLLSAKSVLMLKNKINKENNFFMIERILIFEIKILYQTQNY